jgi:uncharacterized membrane protein YqjE
MLLKLLTEAWHTFGASNQSNGDSLSALDALRILRSAGNTMVLQAGLYSQLAKLEWAQEKERLTRMALAVVVALVCFVGTLLFAGVLLLAIVWDTEYRIPTLVGLVVAYASGVGIALWRLKVLAQQGANAFKALRLELAADIAIIKSQL